MHAAGERAGATAAGADGTPDAVTSAGLPGLIGAIVSKSTAAAVPHRRNKPEDRIDLS